MQYKYIIHGIEKNRRKIRTFYSRIRKIAELRKSFKLNNPKFDIKFIIKSWTYEKLTEIEGRK